MSKDLVQKVIGMQPVMNLRRKKTLLHGIVFTLLPIVLFYLMEGYEHNPFIEVRKTAQLFNILLFELLAWMFFALTKSGRAAIRILAATSMVFGLTNHYVMEFRSTPFVPWDIFSIRTAASVAENYDFTPGIRVVLVTIGFVAILMLSHFLSFRFEKKLPIRLISAAAIMAVLVFFSERLQNESFQLSNGLYPFLFTPAYMTKVNGMAVTFVMDMAYVKVDKPKGYNKTEAAQILEENGYLPQEAQQDSRPNLIVIMDEAFSDLAVLGEVKASEDYMPYVHSLMEGADNTVSGYLHVSVCGGNTANTEYEFLTGNSMESLPAGSIPYQQYIKREVPSVADYLNSLGYETYAMHPYNSTGWDRDKVYPWMGFEHTLFLKDMSNVEKLRTYASDAYDFKKVIELYEKKEEKTPIFIFNVTMQNHGSYTETYDNFTPDITVEGCNSVALSQYLSLIKQTDEDFKNLISYFENQEEKTMIVFFGDHQPANAVAKYIADGDTKEEDRYKVPYVIWANYDIKEECQADTSVNYLAATALEIAGIPNSDYNQFLLDLKQYYPVYSAVNRIENENPSDGKPSKTAQEMLLDYEKLQYYRLLDWEEEK